MFDICEPEDLGWPMVNEIFKAMRILSCSFKKIEFQIEVQYFYSKLART